MGRIGPRWLWTRRPVVIALAVLLCIAAFVAWRQTHRCDSRLVGRWLVTQGKSPTAEQVKIALRRSELAATTEWVFNIDGTGRQDNSTASFGPIKCRWETHADRLLIRWGTDVTGWEWFKLKAEDLYCVLLGRRRNFPVYEYEYTIEQRETIRVEPKAGPWKSLGEVIYLTRIGD